MALGYIRVGTQGGGPLERKERQYGCPKMIEIAPRKAHYPEMYPKPPPARNMAELMAQDREHYNEMYPKQPPARKRVGSIAPGRAHNKDNYPKPAPVQKRVGSIAPRGRGEHPKHQKHPKAASCQPKYRGDLDRPREQPPAQRPRRREEPRRRSPSPPRNIIVPKRTVASYREIKALGKGGQGECHLVQRRSDGRKFVRKVSHTFPIIKSSGQPLEASILEDVLGQHERAIKLIDYAVAEGSLVTIYEFYGGGDLVSWLPSKYERPSESFIWCIFFQLADVLSYLHEGFDYKNPYSTALDWRPVIHCDIKPENIFLRGVQRGNPYPSIVLGDFGLATLCPGTTYGGTRPYQSPELDRTGNTKASDVWALGATIHELVHGYTPDRHRGADPLPKSFSSSLDRTVRACLIKDPSWRISARELVWRINRDYYGRQ